MDDGWMMAEWDGWVGLGVLSSVSVLQGSFLIYPIASEEDDADFQITNGIPKNTPLKLLARVYVVKVKRGAVEFILSYC